MKFDLTKHNAYFEKVGWTHSGRCLCNQFKDGEDMWKPTDVPIIPIKRSEPINTRDPSQSQQSWHEQDEGREMKKMFED